MKNFKARQGIISTNLSSESISDQEEQSGKTADPTLSPSEAAKKIWSQ
jgi:hypothetical protein